MGQQEVYNFLREHPEDWFTSRDIEKLLNISIGSINESLRRLRERGEINYKVSSVNGKRKSQYVYNYKQ